MVISARHRWPEPADFSIHRPAGLDTYTFLHFHNAVQIECGGARVAVKPGACILYAPGMPQWFHSKEPLLHDWMHLDSPAATVLFQKYQTPAGTLQYPADGSFITSAICEIELELYSDRLYSKDLADLTAEMLFLRFSRICSEKDSRPAIQPELSAKLFLFRSALFTRLGESWTVERMAAEMHLSPSRFFAVYKARFGISPVNDLIQARMDAAKSALISSDVSVAQLAERLGYANVTHFSRQFRQKTGVSPRDYVKQ